MFRIKKEQLICVYPQEKYKKIKKKFINLIKNKIKIKCDYF